MATCQHQAGSSEERFGGLHSSVRGQLPSGEAASHIAVGGDGCGECDHVARGSPYWKHTQRNLHMSGLRHPQIYGRARC